MMVTQSELLTVVMVGTDWNNSMFWQNVQIEYDVKRNVKSDCKCLMIESERCE